MRSLCFYLVLIVFSANGLSFRASAQSNGTTPGDDRINRLETLADIWGKLWLFHPAIVTQSVNWDQALIEALPAVETARDTEKLVEVLNDSLFASLGDLTVVAQAEGSLVTQAPHRSLSALMLSDSVGYLSVADPYQQTERGFLAELLGVMDALDSAKRLVVDPRFQFEPSDQVDTRKLRQSVNVEWLRLFVDRPIRIGNYVRRKHFGWNQYNSARSSYYQTWDFFPRISPSGLGVERILPLRGDRRVLRQLAPSLSPDQMTPETRPTLFLVNNSSYPIVDSVLDALQATGRAKVAWERTGAVVDWRWSRERTLFEYDGFRVWFSSTRLLSRSEELGLQPDFIENEPITYPRAVELAGTVPNRSAQPSSMSLPEMRFSSPEPPTAEPLTREQRLLALFKIWAVLEYFFPHLEFAELDLESDLGDWIRLIEQTTGPGDFYDDLLPRLAAKLNDSHVRVYPPRGQAWWARYGDFRPPVRLGYVENQVIVESLHKKAAGADIAVGDTVVAIDSKPIEEVERHFRERISASTEQAFHRYWPQTVVGPKDSEIALRLKRDDRVWSVRFRRTLTLQDTLRPAGAVQRSLDGGIGYINLRAIRSIDHLDRTFDSLSSSEGLIFDLRRGERLGRISPKIQWFVDRFSTGPVRRWKQAAPLVTGPGEFSFVRPVPELIEPSQGEKFHNPVIILVGPIVQSIQETLCMALRQIATVTLVGENTAGTTGESTRIYLPGGAQISFTGGRGTFPDGSRFQNLGVTPDVQVYRTISGIQAGRDEVLEQGIEVLRRKIEDAEATAR